MLTLLDAAAAPDPVWTTWTGIAVVSSAVTAAFVKIAPIIRRWWADKRKADREDRERAARHADEVLDGLHQRLEHERDRRHEAEDALAEALRRIGDLESEGARKDQKIAQLEDRLAELEAVVRALRLPAE